MANTKPDLVKKKHRKRNNNNKHRKTTTSKTVGDDKGNGSTAQELLVKAEQLELAARNTWVNAQRVRAARSKVLHQQKADATVNAEKLSDEQLFSVDGTCPPWEEVKGLKDIEMADDPQQDQARNKTGSKKRRREDGGDDSDSPESTDNKVKKRRKRTRKPKTVQAIDAEHSPQPEAPTSLAADPELPATDLTPAIDVPVEGKDKRRKRAKRNKVIQEETGQPSISGDADAVEVATEKVLAVTEPSAGGEDKKKRKKVKKDKVIHEEIGQLSISEGTVEAAIEQVPAATESSDGSEEKKVKKAKKIKKVKSGIAEEATNGDTTMTITEDLAEEPLEKSVKRKKSRKSEKGSSSKDKNKADNIPAEEEKGTEDLERWNVLGLEGGSARQAKFLSLLGGKKAGLDKKLAADSDLDAGSGKQRLDANRIEKELETQFESGMKAKHDGGGKRRGLGA